MTLRPPETPSAPLRRLSELPCRFAFVANIVNSD